MEIRRLIATLVLVVGVIAFISITIKGVRKAHYEALQIQRLGETSMILKHSLFPPIAFGVNSWSHGDSAVYDVRDGMADYVIRYTVAITTNENSETKWLLCEASKPILWGFRSVIREATENDVSLDGKRRIYGVTEAQFAMPLQLAPQFNPDLLFENVCEEPMRVKDMTLQTRRTLVMLASARSAPHPVVEVWTHPGVKPLGIVKMRDGQRELVLRAWESRSVSLTPLIGKCIESYVGRQSISCRTCHNHQGELLDITLRNGLQVEGSSLDLLRLSHHIIPNVPDKQSESDLRITVDTPSLATAFRVTANGLSTTVYTTARSQSVVVNLSLLTNAVISSVDSRPLTLTMSLTDNVSSLNW